MPTAATTAAARATIPPAHAAAAAMWGLGGRAYDRVSFAISDALAHAGQRLNPQPGEAVLDIGTGTGWSARNAARRGARVTGIDIAAELLAAAQALSAHLRPPIEFRLGAAERLPVPDAAFDRVISTFGVMFALDPEQAAAELARVCRPGGRLVLASWAPAGAVAVFFGLIGKHARQPPPDPSPLAWGDPARLEALLGRDFALTFEPGTSHAYHDSVEDIWRWYAEGFGPVRQLLQTLGPADAAAFRRDIDAYHGHYLTAAGLLHVRRDYLVTIGRRR
jgi:SAM-dependent methyltransferase